MAQNKRNYLTVIDVCVSAGAAIIILAAWAKLTHQPWADIGLAIGMWTETAIFLVYAALDWINPKSHDEDHGGKEASAGALQSMEDMMQKAEITPANMKKLSESFQKFGTTVNGISDVSEVVKNTGDFGNKTKDAAAAMDKMNSAFTASAQTMGSFNNAAQSAKGFHEQVQVLTKNLGSLNTIYELELKESNNHLKALNTFYGKLAEASQAMMTSVEDANKVREQIGSLANNLGKLNTVYGNMLTAMQGK
jgi:gliding motility-associated protein GldL